MATPADSSSSGGGQTLFVRKASGLIKGWSAYDGFLYAFFACNVIVGFVGISYCAFIPGGSLFWGIVIATAFIMLEVVVYAVLTSAMPRSGGDYVWQTRIFNSPTGFILAATGWWFILWQWIPVYASITVIAFIVPMARIVGWNGLADWLATPNGVFVSAVVVIGGASWYVALGMKGYAKVQRWTFYLGMGGLVIAGLLLLIFSKAHFITSFNREALSLYGVKGAYQAVLKAGAAGQPSNPFAGGFAATIALLPFLMFNMLWPNWGATLVGEVRGAGDFRKNLYAMGGALIFVAATMIAFLLLAWKTMGYQWMMASSAAYWNGTSPLKGDYISPVASAFWLVNNHAVQFILLAIGSCIIWGWYGTVFLSSTRVVFASAFDRILPESAAKVTSGGVPWVALLLMAIPSMGISALYAYTSWYARFTLDTTLVIAVTYLVTCLAAIVFPWRLKKVWETASVPKWKIAGVPVMSIVAALFSAFLVVQLVYWLKDAVYGVNDKKSLAYMGCLYAAAAVIWIIAAVVRRRQGMALEAVAHEIPVE
jgi:basic amino acid/polyamine antiporter, APA family